MNKMANYKGIKFNNTTEDFKRWTKEFPPLDKDAVVAQGFKKEGNYYMELQLVDGFLGAGKFVSATIREYVPAEADFESISYDKEKELLAGPFKNKLEAFKTKYNAGGVL
jgi:hypothetical protein